MKTPLPVLPILACGPGWIVFDKPAGLSVHNDPNGDAISLAARALESDADLRAATCPEANFGPAPVHRLDRETSGCLLIATSKVSARDLAAAFAEREGVTKTYRAVLYGTPAPAQGTWDQPLSDRSEGLRDPQGPLSSRQPCATDYRVTHANAFLAEAEIDLRTGRQHQIRRHAALSGHAVIGDTRYADARHARRIERLYGVSRLLLHAEKLAVRGVFDVTAPCPPEFARVFQDPDVKPGGPGRPGA